jgi:LmbE family N-acetylglucosaminyl deacetylase
MLSWVTRLSSEPLACSDLVVSARTAAAPSKLMVVAHPDDESLFGGEALTSSPGWHVVCVTNASNETRRREFVDAMRSINTSYTMLDHADNLRNGTFGPLLQEQLSALWRELPYEFVVTHNAAGEYGHPQHAALHRTVRRVVTVGPVYVFDHAWMGRPRMSDAKRALLDHYVGQRVSIEHRAFLARRERLRRVQ